MVFFTLELWVLSYLFKIRTEDPLVARNENDLVSIVFNNMRHLHVQYQCTVVFLDDKQLP